MAAPSLPLTSLSEAQRAQALEPGVDQARLSYLKYVRLLKRVGLSRSYAVYRVSCLSLAFALLPLLGSWG